MEALRDVIGCGQYWAEQRAQIALDLADQYARQELSRDEYLALLQDLVNTDVLDAESNDVAVKGMLITGVMALMSVA